MAANAQLLPNNGGFSTKDNNDVSAIKSTNIDLGVFSFKTPRVGEKNNDMRSMMMNTKDVTNRGLHSPAHHTCPDEKRRSNGFTTTARASSRKNGALRQKRGDVVVTAPSSRKKNGNENVNDGEGDWTMRAEAVLREEWHRQGGESLEPGGAHEWHNSWFSPPPNGSEAFIRENMSNSKSNNLHKSRTSNNQQARYQKQQQTQKQQSQSQQQQLKSQSQSQQLQLQSQQNQWAKGGTLPLPLSTTTSAQNPGPCPTPDEVQSNNNNNNNNNNGGNLSLSFPLPSSMPTPTQHIPITGTIRDRMSSMPALAGTPPPQTICLNPLYNNGGSASAAAGSPNQVIVQGETFYTQPSQPSPGVPWYVPPPSKASLQQQVGNSQCNAYGEQEDWESIWTTMGHAPPPVSTPMQTYTSPSFANPAMISLMRPLVRGHSGQHPNNYSNNNPFHHMKHIYNDGFINSNMMNVNGNQNNLRGGGIVNGKNGNQEMHEPLHLSAGNLRNQRGYYAAPQLTEANLQKLGSCAASPVAPTPTDPTMLKPLEATTVPYNQSIPGRVRRQVTKRYEMMIHECAKRLDGQEAMSILRYMWHQGIEPSIRAFTSTISTLTKSGQWQEALQLFASMNKYCGTKSNVYCHNAAMSACRKGKRWKLALDILGNMKRDELHPDVISYSTAISACEKSGKVDEALSLLKEMKADGMSPDVIIYSATISACEKGGRVDNAIALLEEMQANEVHPDVITYNATISACEKGGASDEAIKLLKQMETERIEPDVISYTAVISACAKGGRHIEALALLNQMKEKRVEPSVITLSAAISACAKDGKYLEALSLLDGMKQLKIEPNVISYSAAISACGKASQWKHGLNLLNDMKTQAVRPDAVTYNAIISACEQSGKWEVSTNLYREAYDLWLFNHWRVGTPQSQNQGLYAGNEPLQANFLEYPLAAAKAALRMIMEDFWKSSQQRADVFRPLIIIVGRGARREPVLLPGLLKMCNEEFQPSLDAERVFNVPGRIQVTAASIRAWVAAQDMIAQKTMNNREMVV